MRAAKRLGVVIACVVAGLAALSAGACSASSTLVGNGACDGWCNKVVAAKCKVVPTRDECLTRCMSLQTDYGERCTWAENDLLRCATIDGNVGCDKDTGAPKPTQCDQFVRVRDRECVFKVDAGAFDATGP